MFFIFPHLARKKMVKITQEMVRERFEYREDGGLYYRYGMSNQIRKGMRFGSVSALGYREGHIHNEYCLEHTVIFLYHHGRTPTGEIDHINRDRLDNRIENLREVTRSQNIMNSTPQKGCKSIYKGVWKVDKCKLKKEWRASIRINYKKKHLGYFLTEIEAASAYNEAAIELFGDFACLNEVKK